MGACAECGTPHPASARFCAECGTKLPEHCPACGATVTEGSRFCSECGSGLTPARARVVPASAEGAIERGTDPIVSERRVCSILFADLVSFTQLAEAWDPEQVRELLSDYFDLARTVITRYGGIVEKFIGDAVMAVWGTPIAREGDCERAVRAALELTGAIAAVGERTGAPDLALRAAVVNAEVAVTIGARGQGMVAGGAVNTAARLQAAARSGTVLVDDATRTLAAGAIDFADAGYLNLKGKTGRTHAWSAERVLANVGGVQRSDGLEAPLIGRDVELRTLKALFHATVDRRTPRSVLVSAEAGTGKTRMGWEYEKYIDGLADAVLWHRGRCLNYGEGAAFWPLAEIVRQRFGIAEDDPTAVAADRIASQLPRLVPDSTEQLYIGARLGRLLGLDLPGVAGESLPREELFAGWRLFLERLATTAPVVLLIEDAQHADAALLDFVEHVVDWARDAPIFIVLFARPELAERRPELGTGRHRTVLALDPLEPSDMQSLVRALLPGVDAVTVAAIAGPAKGNPHFGIEIVRSLIERRAVVATDSGFELAGDLDLAAVPKALHELLAARLDALRPDLRTLVATASVLGTAFSAEALAAIADRPRDRTDAALTELVRRDVLEISADPLSPQRGTYRFGQDMLRQVAYAMLSRRDRKARHLAIAQHLRTAFANDGEEVIRVVAQHYLDALAAVPEDPDTVAIRVEAVRSLRRAAERAEGTGAPGQAARIYADAAELQAQVAPAGSRATVAELDELAALAYERVGDLAQAIAYAERARAIHEAEGSIRGIARTGARLGRIAGLLGRHHEARAALTDAVEILLPQPDHDTVFALGELAALEIMAGTPGGHDRIDAALVLGQALAVPNDVLARLFMLRGISHSRNNRRAEGTASLEYAAGLAERDQNGRLLSLVLSNLSQMLDGVDAVRAARTSADLARRVGATGLFAAATDNLAWAQFFVGDWDGAAEVLATAIAHGGLADHELLHATTAVLAALRGDLATATEHDHIPDLRASEDPQNQAAAWVVDAFVATADGRHADALGTALRILGHIDALGLTIDLTYWTWALAVRTAFRLDDLEAVQNLLEMLASHPVGHLPPLLQAEQALARARLRAGNGDADAEAALDAAVARLREVGSPYHLAQALLDLAEYLDQAGHHVRATATVDEAEAIARRLSAGPVIARCLDVRPPDAGALSAT